MMLVAKVGWARPVPVDMRYFKHPKQGMALTALAGPAANFLTALLATALASLVWHFAPLGRASLLALCFLSNMALLGIGMGLFNLIPISPWTGPRSSLPSCRTGHITRSCAMSALWASL